MGEPEEFQRLLESMVEDGDLLMAYKQFAQAIQSYTECAELLWEMKRAQQASRRGSPSQEPVSLRVMLANRLLIVPLHRLAGAHYHCGDYLAARRCLRQIVVLLEEFTNLAGGETRREGATMLEAAREELREADAGRFNL